MKGNKFLKKVLIYLLVFFIILSLTSCHKDEVKAVKVVNGYTDIGDLKLDQVQMPKKGEEIAVITTSMGTMKMRLFEEVAPESIKLFKNLVKEGYYDGILFTRIQKDFVNQVQGKDIKKDILEDEYYRETSPNYKHLTGAVGFAGDREGHQGKSFYIVVNSGVEEENIEAMELVGEDIYPKDTIDAYKAFGGVPRLDTLYTIFGQVFYGLDVLIEMNQVEVKENTTMPVKPIVVENVEIEIYN